MFARITNWSVSFLKKEQNEQSKQNEQKRTETSRNEQREIEGY
jgi:hypothetical protein